MAASYCCEVDDMTGTKSKEIPATGYLCNGKLLTFEKPRLMAIVNLTTDSFYDGGKYDGLNDVLRDVTQKIAAGADIIDLGAASSRPGALPLPADVEWSRIEPVLLEIRNSFPDTFISVDTFYSSVARKAAAAGADIINDISGGSIDRNMLDTICDLDLPYVMMHLDGTPATMQRNKPYAHVVQTVSSSLAGRAAALRSKDFNKIILDPGFGFGKSLQNNYQLLKGLPELCSLGYPVLVGLSRKSMIGKITGGNPVTSLNGTTALHTIALLNGARILRVHDAEEAKQVIELVEYYSRA